jgi:hypothetical protein
MAGLTIKPYILSKKGNYQYVIPHETVHIRQQEQYGMLGFLIRYYFSANWRVRFEAAAYAVDVRDGVRSPENAAASIASGLYFWPCTQEQAAAVIKEELAKLGPL